MRIVHVTPLLAPFGSTLPEAVVTSELAPAQGRAGADVTVLSAVPTSWLETLSRRSDLARRVTPLTVTDGSQSVDVTVLEGVLEGGAARMLLLLLPGPADRHRTVFAAAAVQLLVGAPFRPDLVHLHQDTGLGVEDLRERLGGATVVLSLYRSTGVDVELVKTVEDADAVVLPGGVVQLGEAPEVLAAALKARLASIRVIPSGLAIERWDPLRDHAIPAPFGPGALAGKAACRAALQQVSGFAPRQDAPVVAILAGEAEPEAVAAAVAAAQELDLQLVVLGPESLRGVGARPEGHLAPLAFRAQAEEADLRSTLAGADAAILPSSEAPDGRLARIAMRYAVVPVARRVRAHLDVLVEYDAESRTGGAFLFEDDGELGAALRRLRATFDEPEAWATMASRNAAVDSGWPRTVALLDEIYRKALAR